MKLQRRTTVAVAAISALIVGASMAGNATASPTFSYLKNRGTDKCLAIPGGSTQGGIGLIQWKCGDWEDHQWKLEEAFTSDVMYYRVVNKKTNMCLAVPGGSTEDGVQVIQWPCGDWLDHYWRFEAAGTNKYRVINRASGKCLGVDAGSKANGARVIQWPCGTWRDHYWKRA